MRPFAAATGTVGKAIRRLPYEDGRSEERAELEEKHAKRLAAAMRRMLREMVPEGTTEADITPDLAIERFRANNDTLRDELVVMLMAASLLGAQTGQTQMGALMGVRHATVGVTDWDMINEDVLRWVLGTTGGTGTGYADIITAALGQTSEPQIRRLVAEWVQNKLPLQHLSDSLLQFVFSEQRARTVAITETTRAYAEGNMAAWRASGLVQKRKWLTVNDERVCPICGALHGRIAGLNEPFGAMIMSPPAHPNCRCILVPYVERIEQEETAEIDRVLSAAGITVTARSM